jgi:hypothetical protein
MTGVTRQGCTTHMAASWIRGVTSSKAARKFAVQCRLLPGPIPHLDVYSQLSPVYGSQGGRTILITDQLDLGAGWMVTSVRDQTIA